MSVQQPRDRDLADAVWADFAGGKIQPPAKREPPQTARQRRLVALLIATLLGGGGSVAALSALNQLAQQQPTFLESLVAACLGAVPGVFAYLLLREPLDPRKSKRTDGPPVAIIYSPLPAQADPQALAMEERLLHLCKQDRYLFERLLQYEAERHPTASRTEQLRQAINHFDRDNV
jgi:hypothetical protein